MEEVYVSLRFPRDTVKRKLFEYSRNQAILAEERRYRSFLRKELAKSICFYVALFTLAVGVPYLICDWWFSSSKPIRATRRDPDPATVGTVRVVEMGK